MSDEKKVHPLRRKHRRGKRGGKRHKAVVQLAPNPTPAPQVQSLRNRLSLLAKASHG